jgi:peptide/nickel transport system ATP-binding protein
MDNILSVKGLTVRFYTYDGVVKAVEDVSFDIGKKETFGLVGETGCGKTMTALSILRLIPPPGCIENGNIYLSSDNGSKPIDLLAISEQEIRGIRGSTVSIIFQEPSSALNPVFSIGEQIAEMFLIHKKKEMAKRALVSVNKVLQEREGIRRFFSKPALILQRHLYANGTKNVNSLLIKFVSRIPLLKGLLWRIRNEAEKAAINMLKKVEIPDSHRIARQYPHELSGGMKQRAVIAMSLACDPQFLIADEPTTALDVTIQSQILELLRKLKEDFDSSVLYITHDLAVAAQICDKIAVMYSGRICEIAPVEMLFSSPTHPYTRALLDAVPKPGIKPQAIIGNLPDPTCLPQGCRFWPRCSLATSICKDKMPEMVEVGPNHFVACYNWRGETIEDSS